MVNDGNDDTAIGDTVVPSVEPVRRLAAQRDAPADTALLFRRNEEGGARRDRAANGTLTSEDKAALPRCFHELIPHLRPPTNPATGVAVGSAGYVNMVDESGAPRIFTRAILRRKLGKIAKGKAPGYTGNGSDLYASLPGAWVEWAVELVNVIPFTQITSDGWHIDLIHYVHEGGSGGSLPTTDRWRWWRCSGK